MGRKATVLNGLYYTIYDQDDNNVFSCDTKEELAKELGITLSTLSWYASMKRELKNGLKIFKYVRGAYLTRLF